MSALSNKREMKLLWNAYCDSERLFAGAIQAVGLNLKS